MLIVEAQNITGGSGERLNGFSDYRVKIFINDRPIWAGVVKDHFRAEGAGTLLVKIGVQMQEGENGLLSPPKRKK